jgi:signal peptidase
MCSIIGAKMQGKVPQVFGYSVVNIISGSMGDTIPEGSYILVKEVTPEEVKKDDIICFYSSDPSISGLPNTHRVIKEPIMTETGIEFVTKGDANVLEDTYTAKGENLIGLYVKNMDKLEAFVSMLDGGGFNALFIIIEVMIVAMVVCGFLRVRKDIAREAARNEGGEEQVLSKEEIEKMIGDNPEPVKEIETRLGLPSKSNESDKKDTEQ